MAKQTKAIKNLSSQNRLALTGTPVENSLYDLWSLFDFALPQLLGNLGNFKNFIKNDDNKNIYAALRNITQPYILRRLKTDKKIINDLPDKIEIKSYCQLSKTQIALYQNLVESLARELVEKVSNIERQGLVLNYLIKFKQVCNHPSQLIKDQNFLTQDSGKFLQLEEIAKTIFAKQEKLLVFTQFKEMTGVISDFLEKIFNKKGLVLHGETNAKKRSEMVSDFQKDDGPPYFVLSLKAGGVGLNLTAASHVVHFDRWWNPAVENQATDRAFRIGQKKNVLVHKFICQGTLEDQIDKIIESKQNLSNEVLNRDGGIALTEMTNEELLKIVSLDIKSASY